MTPKELQQIRAGIAHAVKAKREALGISQRTLAKQCGIGEQTVIRMEQTTYWPNVKQLLLVSDALGLNFRFHR